MNARDEAVEMIRRICPAHLSADKYGRVLAEKFDTHRAEVLAKAIGRLRAIPVTCTALTGPVWYGDGWNSAITQLEEIADYQGPDDEEYPGELQRLRATVLALRVAALRKEDLARVQQVLADHEDWRKKATASDAEPDFFEPGRTYRREHHGRVIEFLVRFVDTAPDCNFPTAFGWRKDPEIDVALPMDSDDLDGWTDITESKERNI
ncbi:hypothetical protein ACFU96_48365 [Streptomyces sp. NPDC057620]|uniref:hypothetical protein n=1 Tax=Streptomyces sp. NPDC057620 TaxID=3346185 RepID=UPI0036CA75C4